MGNILTRRQSYNLDGAVDVNQSLNVPSHAGEIYLVKIILAEIICVKSQVIKFYINNLPIASFFVIQNLLKTLIYFPASVAKSENRIKEEIKRDLEEFDASIKNPSDTFLDQSPPDSK